MPENVLRFLAWLIRWGHCPYCRGQGPDGDHRDGCPTLDTCSQFGPPWVLDVLHADDPLHPSRVAGESLADYYARCDEWNAVRRDHLRTVHGMTRVA